MSHTYSIAGKASKTCSKIESLEQRIACLANAGPAAIDGRLAELEREWTAGRMTKATIGVAVVCGMALAAINPWWLILPAVAGLFLLSYVFGRTSALGLLFHELGFRSGFEVDQEKMALKVLRGDFKQLPTLLEIESREDISRLEGEGGIALDPEEAKIDPLDAAKVASMRPNSVAIECVQERRLGPSLFFMHHRNRLASCATDAICGESPLTQIVPTRAGGVAMRRAPGILLLAAVFVTVIGCFTTGSQTVETADIGPPTGDKDHTLEYWGKVREVMRLRSDGPSDLRQLSEAVRKQADTVRHLQIDGVDMELIVAANAVAQSQEKMLKVVDAANCNIANIRVDPELKTSYTSAGQQIATAMANLKALAPRLSARYKVTFPPIDDVQK